MKIIHLDEEQLVDGCLAGERTSQKQLYERYYGSMLAVCIRYTSNREEARDVLHEGFVKVFKSLGSFQRGTNLVGWIRRIMVNTSIDQYRKDSRIPPSMDIETAYYVADVNDVVADMSAQEILDLVQLLPAAYRTVFNLYAVEGYQHREISDLLGISEGTSKSNLSKARTRLQYLIFESRKTTQQTEGERYA